MIAFTAFFCSEDPVKVKEYLRYMRLGQQALELTLPKARYVVLTDKKTAPLLEPYMEIAVTAPSDAPQMMKCILAQAAFEKGCRDDISILAAPDCAVSRRDLPDSIQHPFIVTYRRDFSINNVGYARDHDLAHWFLLRAADKLDSLPADQLIWINHGFFPIREWGGDQEGWRMALGKPPWPKLGEKTKQRFTKVEGRKIYLYPMDTHNHPVRLTGEPKRGTYDAYLLHFKGDRKQYMERFVVDFIPNWTEKRRKVSRAEARKLEKRAKKALECELRSLDTLATGEKSLPEF